MTKNKKVRLGVINSAGGSVLKELCHLRGAVDFDISVVTDRECGTEAVCRELGVECTRIEESDNWLFSKKSAEHFKEIGGVDGVLLLFTRIVGRDLFNFFLTFNIHPSFLPAFKGFRPLEQAARAGVKIVGATLHVVDENVDGGPIVAQVASAIKSYDEPYLQKISFLQKTLLAFLLVDIFSSSDVLLNGGKVTILRELSGGHPYNPVIKELAILEAFRRVEEENGLKIL